MSSYDVTQANSYCSESPRLFQILICNITTWKGATSGILLFMRT